MKNLFRLLFVLIMSSSISFSQVPVKTILKEAPKHHTVRDSRALINSTSSNRHLINKLKINFIDMTSSYYSSSPDYDFYYLFPDSAVKALYGTTVGAPFHHSFSQVFDMRSPIINSNTFGTTMLFDTNLPFEIDTIASFGVYQPSKNPSVVDTIIYRVIPSSTNNLNMLATVSGTLFPLLESDSNTFLPPGVLAEYKIPLNLADTLPNGLMYPKIYSGAIVPSLFAITIDFKPGGSYSPFTDTMGYGVGSYTQVTAEHNGDGTTANLIIGDFTGAHLLTSEVRYNNGGVWNGYYTPHFAYAAGQFEAVDIDLTVSQNNSISIEEKEKEALLFQNVPNPVRGFTTVRYSLENQAQILFEMIDITGKKVISINEGSKTTGVHTIELNTDKLNAGIYFYSILVDGQRITKKMTINN